MGIIFGNENQIPKAIEEYIIKMGLNCMITSDYGFSGSTIYHNVYTMCYWIHRNMIDVSHMSFFYATSLHIIDCMMSMYTQLLGYQIMIEDYFTFTVFNHTNISHFYV